MKIKMLLILTGLVFMGLSLVTSPVMAIGRTPTPEDTPTLEPTETETLVPTDTPTVIPTNTEVPLTDTPNPTNTSVATISIPTPTETGVIEILITPIAAWTSTPTDTPTVEPLSTPKPKKKDDEQSLVLLPETGGDNYNPFMWLGMMAVGIFLLFVGFRKK